MVQTGLRVGEVAALQIADLTVRDRSGSVHVRYGKGLKDRESLYEILGLKEGASVPSAKSC